ncbi:glycoside hydrolase family 88 protein [[Clostridium] fimetarium]|uniref:Rhamnogalacturonyl hydrolase YesR n=1 Tax=[Clostridium] fimetarium TaxID=99656 RepID=A0A1I0RHP3_9FIRM|nr:glycoside hydrolase family 88 protein [[Clostridium] fimetarium]SEW39779.1 Rhamnogalacturonyl hydrolase YesR [[Clostridium] fimetarium]
MGRIENAVRNILFGTLGNFASIILGFVSRTFLIHILGVNYLGINGLYTNVLSVLSLAELGIGTAISYSLYKPVVDKDLEKIKILMQLYKQVYRIIAIIITALGLLIIPFLKYIIKNPGDITLDQLNIFYLIFLFNTVSTYFVSYKYSLTNAEQKNYIQINIQVITSLTILIAQIIILIVSKSFLIYLLAGAVIGLIQKIFVYIYFNKLYPYLLEKSNGNLSKEEIKVFKKNIIALLYHKIGETSINQTDNIIISSFINITCVAILSNYNLIINTVNVFINIVFNSVISGLGNLIATENKERQYLLFKVYRFLGFWVYGLSLLFFVFLLTPFINIWLGPNMIIDKSAIILIMVDYYFKGHRTVINNFKSAAGIFDADKYISIAQAVVNLVLSIILVQFIGLKGVFIGTIVAGLIANVTKPFIIYKMIFNKDAKYYFIDSITYIFTISFVFAILGLLNTVVLVNITLINIIIMGFLILSISNIIFYVILRQREEFAYLSNIILSKIGEKVKEFYYTHCLLLITFLKKARNLIAKETNKFTRNKENSFEQVNDFNTDRYSEKNKKMAFISELTKNTRIQLSIYPVVSMKHQIISFINNTSSTKKDEKIDHYFRQNGLLAQSLEWSYSIDKDIQDLNSLQKYFDKWTKSGALINSLENAINGYTLIYLNELTPNDKYKNTIEKIKDYLFAHPKDKSGSLLYRKSFDDVYIESVGMICPFLCRYGKAYHNQMAIDLAINQMINYLKYGFDSKTSLPYHGYNIKGNIKHGIIGWGRAVGWLLIGMIDSLEYISSTNPYYKILRYQFEVIIKTTVKYQTNSGYYKWQLTAFEGHVDTSATSMISYAIKRGVMIGILNRSFLHYSNLGLLAISHSIENGVVMDSSAECTGFGIYPQDYGSNQWAQGPTTALVALSLNQETKIINNKIYRRS